MSLNKDLKLQEKNLEIKIYDISLKIRSTEDAI